MSKLDERIVAVVNSILSGVNACDTIKKHIDDGTIGDYIQQMVRPTLEVYDAEYRDLLHRYTAESEDCNRKRHALESVIANCVIDNPHVQDAIKDAMPLHPEAGKWKGTRGC